MVTLAERIAEIEADTSAVFGPHNARMAELIKRIEQTDRRPKPGTAAPMFAMPNAEGQLRRLDQLTGPRGLVLMFIRGLWCPYCNAQMRSFEEAAEALTEAGLALAIVTPEVGGRAAETKRNLGLSAEVLCDVDEGVALSYGCLFRVPPEDQAFLVSVGYDLTTLYGNQSWFMPLATTFLIARDGTVAAVFGESDQRRRPDPQTLLEAAGALPVSG